MKKIPMRSCIVTLEKSEKKDLIRVVKNKDGEVFIDLTGKSLQTSNRPVIQTATDLQPPVLFH